MRSDHIGHRAATTRCAAFRIREPDPADGKAGTHTMIAISPFQVEKGMKVTGEVTAQPAGILAAEVDARR